MAQALERCLLLGAKRPDFQPGGDSWTVLTDPACYLVLPVPGPERVAG